MTKQENLETIKQELDKLGWSVKEKMTKIIFSQKKLKLTEFRSFNGLNAFPATYYSDLIYSHLGIGSEQENKLKEEMKKNQNRKKELEDRSKMLNEMNKEITSKGSSNLNIEDLRSKIYIHEENYKKISNKLNKHKNALMKAHNTRVELEILLKELDRAITDEKADLRKGLNSHTCPYCETELKDEESYYFHRVKHIDGYGVQRLTIEEQLSEINRTIELENNHYDVLQKEAKEIENKIFSESKEIKGERK